MKEAIFYDDSYFQALENRYFLGAHGERVRDIVSFLPSRKHVLDYGAGSGYFAFRALQLENTVVAFDFAPAAVQYMRSHYPTLEIVERKDALKGVYDTILLNDVIEHVDYSEQASFISNLREHLKAGGRLIVATDNFDSFFFRGRLGKKCLAIDQRISPEGIIYRAIKKGETERPYYHNAYNDSHVGLLGRDKLVRLFKSQGFELVREKHGFLFRTYVSRLISACFGLRPLHSVYEFTLMAETLPRSR